MKKVFILSFIFCLLFMTEAFGVTQEVKFKDVPPGHWAEKAVYDLVELGITRGFPDGTFRGENTLTRYQTAIFLSREALAIEKKISRFVATEGKEGKFLSDNLKKMRQDLKEIKKPTTLKYPLQWAKSDILVRYRVGNLTSYGVASSSLALPLGPQYDWRLKYLLLTEVNKSVKLELNLDTMDAGWGNTDRDALVNLLDAKGTVRVGDYDLVTTIGPGPQVHPGGNIAPSDRGTVYLRPRNAIGLAYKRGRVDYSFFYIARSITPEGEVLVDDLAATFGYRFDPKFRISGRLDYLYSSSSPGKLRSKIDLFYKPQPNLETSVTLGIANLDVSPSGYYVGAKIKLDEYKTAGKAIEVHIQRVGSRCFNWPSDLAEDDYFGLNFFDKYPQNGTIDLGAKVAQKISNKLKLTGKIDLVTNGNFRYGSDIPGSSTTGEIGFEYFDPLATIGVNYLLFHDPTGSITTSDLLCFRVRTSF